MPNFSVFNTNPGAGVVADLKILGPQRVMQRLTAAKASGRARARQAAHAGPPALASRRSWETFLALRLPPLFDRGFPWLPEGAMYGFVQAPAAYRHKLLELCRARKDRMAYAELIAAEAVAHSLGEFIPALDWFAMARGRKPERLEPLVRMANCYADASRGHDAAVAPLQTAVPLCLIVQLTLKYEYGVEGTA